MEIEKLPDVSWRGNCYQNCIEFIIRNKGTFMDCKITHGVVDGQGPLKGHTISHSWIESPDGKICFDIEMGSNAWVAISKEEYYGIGVHEDTVKRYTIIEAFIELEKSMNYGPWDEDIINHAKAEYRIEHEIN